MGETVSISQAETHLSRLVAQVEEGREITITRHGRPVARLVPHECRRTPRTPGFWRGRVTVPDDVDSFSAADARDWYGERGCCLTIDPQFAAYEVALLAR